jgi:hypothetical protein
VGAAMEAIGRYMHIHTESSRQRVEQRYRGDRAIAWPPRTGTADGVAGGSPTRAERIRSSQTCAAL